MKKPLLIVDSDTEIKDIKDELDKGYEMFKEAQEFVKKQQESSWKQLVGSHWDKVESVLKERNLLPEDYDDEKYSLGFSDGVLYLTSKGDDDPKKALASMLGMLFNKD